MFRIYEVVSLVIGDFFDILITWSTKYFNLGNSNFKVRLENRSPSPYVMSYSAFVLSNIKISLS